MTVSLPPGHFLNLLPSLGNNSQHGATTTTTTRSSSSTHAVNTASTASADFDVDVRTGFMPFDAPPDTLPSAWAVWEQALQVARGGGLAGNGLSLGGGPKEQAWRRGIEEMPVLSVHQAPMEHSLPLLRRAHQVLTFLLHFYVHCGPQSQSSTSSSPITIPASISIPLFQVCPMLGLPPVLTYADTVLYNSHPTNPSQPPHLVHNPYTRALESFTNTPDEAHFYLTSSRCELAGVEALSLMRACLDEAFMADGLGLTRLTAYLDDLAVRIQEIGEIILEMRTGCDPGVFYHVIRPWFKGGDADGPGSAGWMFMGIDDIEQDTLSSSGREAEFITEEEKREQQRERRQARKISGPSAGQSTLIHALDVFLNVEHSPVEQDHPDGSSDETTPTNTDNVGQKKKTAETTFMTRMLAYMPAPHRAFLDHLGTHPHPVRSLVLAHKHDRPLLVQAYDRAIEALKELRTKHMRIATMYIIQQARRPPTDELIRLGAARPEQEQSETLRSVTSIATESAQQHQKQKLDLSEFIHEVERKTQQENSEIRGTGGTSLIKFLKMCRDNTSRTVIGGQASE